MIVITQEDRKLMKRMAERIQFRMDRLDMSQAELARRTGVSRSEINHILHEKKMPLVSTVSKIAKALNVSIIDLTR